MRYNLWAALLQVHLPMIIQVRIGFEPETSMLPCSCTAQNTLLLIRIVEVAGHLSGEAGRSLAPLNIEDPLQSCGSS